MLRAGLLRLGGSMLGQLLSAGPGQRGPRLPCGQGHEAEFTDYRDKTFDTVLGPVTLRRAWYHCAECKRGFAPRDAELGDRKDEWLAARLEDLGYGYIGGIVAATREYPLTGIKKDEIGTALGYFENNAHRMRDKWFRSCGLFAGSGVVESGCTAIIGQRLRLSGMRWTVTGADAITTLRCQQASRPEERIGQPRRNQAVPA